MHVDDLAEGLSDRSGERCSRSSLPRDERGDAEPVDGTDHRRRHRPPTRSLTVEEGKEFWGEYSTALVMASSSRSTSPRTLTELGWVPERFDIIEELQSVVEAAYADATILQKQTRPTERQVATAVDETVNLGQ